MRSRVMVVGPVGCGKSTLLQTLYQTVDQVKKTVDLNFYSDSIDTPGEYAQVPRFYSALLVTASEASKIIVLQDATALLPTLPPGFAGMFIRPTIGVITKMDARGADSERARKHLLEIGIKEPIFEVSSYSQLGIQSLKEYLEEGGET